MAIPKCAWALLLAFPTTASHADIYACPGKSGMTIYQNFTCNVDTLGSIPEMTQKTRSASTIPAASRSAAPAKPVARPVAVANEGTPTVPKIGMSVAEVRTLWGRPASIYSDELVDGRVEIWSYTDSREVRFNPGGRVVQVERGSD